MRKILINHPAFVDKSVRHHAELCCRAKPACTKVLPLPVPPPYVPRACSCNALAAIVHRVLLSVPVPDPGYLKLLSEESLREFPRPAVNVVPLSFQQWLDSRGYPAPRKAALERAYQSLSMSPVSVHDSRVEAFVKVEKLLKPGVPRLIQPTRDRYLVALGPFIASLEKALVSAHYWLTKGSTYWELSVLFCDCLRHFSDPVVLEVDFSKFDAHVSRDLLEIEHGIYRRYCGDPLLRLLLSWQLFTRGSCRLGWKYARHGGRCSGHPNTSIGNGMLHGLMHLTISKMCGVPIRLMVDGDDGLVFMESDQACRWPLWAYEKFGFSVQASFHPPQHASFCSGMFMPDSPDNGLPYRFIRHPGRVLAKLPWALRVVPDALIPQRAHDLVHAELFLAPNVPLLTPLLRYWHDLHLCGGFDPTKLSWGLAKVDYDQPWDVCRISMVSRLWFADVFDVTVQEQLHIESVIERQGWHPRLMRLVEGVRESALVHEGKVPLNVVEAQYDAMFAEVNQYGKEQEGEAGGRRSPSPR